MSTKQRRYRTEAEKRRIVEAARERQTSPEGLGRTLTIRLNPQGAQTLGMAIHELVTNALKYGALSTDEGVITAGIQESTDRIVVEWSESGGPPVSEPTDFGFGVRVIRDLVEYELSAKVAVEFRPTGLFCRFDLPLDAIAFHGGQQNPE